MSNKTRLPCIIAYDISDRKQLQRVHRLLKQQAIPLQYSVFLGYLNKAERTALMEQIANIITPQTDDIRLYPLPQKPEWISYGKAPWAEGLELAGLTLPDNKSRIE